ncbi:ABC transporter permease [Mammaliicoccus fleurettii]|uniref:ABC transporter permease n=1 Tax=Mammaliicoccus fleurettii TaxID=150056 RepID=UPI001AADC548|nr:ABC transporter permease [Mammaliicoccus fleurettii]MBO3061737.1 ABC transporter permease [Mammaliicoccus fleurettii]
MKPMFNLVVLKQWKQYVVLLLILVLTISVVLMAQTTSNKLFKMPIAVQDMDQSASSKELIHNLEQTKYLEVIHISKDEAYIEDFIEKKEAIVSLQIPKDFSDRLKENRLKDALLLYYKDDFIGEIALEVTSKSLYKQQIPVIIQDHLKKADHKVSMDKIKQEYKKDTPHSKMEHHAVKKNADVSISAGAIIALLLLVSCSQVVLHQRLKQNAALDRLMMFNGTKLKLYTFYIMTHVILLFLIILSVSLILSWSLSILFYVTTLFILIAYEFGLSILLFKINTLSHKLFMAIMWSIAISCLYLYIQI